MSTTKEIFGKVDYAVFALSLLLSASIGVFYAFKDRNKNSTTELLVGGRSMKVFPVAMSVFATSMSAATLLGNPAEIYRYGFEYIMIIFAFCLVIPVTAYLYVPVFHKLGVTSAYQYLELRFHRSVRTIGSVVFLLHMLMYMPVVLLAPALALSEVTGFGVWASVLSIGLVCTFYTSIGGIKAVVWTDVFQAMLMFVAILVVVIKGAIDLGGMDVVWKITEKGERVEFFNFDADPLVRHTTWSIVIGGFLLWTGTFAASQSMVQRYLSIPTLKGAQICLWLNLPALLVLIITLSLCGSVIYAFYSTCDPIGIKVVAKPDQLFPRFVMDTLNTLPGVPGLFVSGIFSGALSTISSGVNALSAITLEDIIKAYIKKDLSEQWAARLTKILAVLFGLVSICLVTAAQNVEGVLEAALTIHGVIGGPMLGIFTLGMFFPFANKWGASIGLISGLCVSMWFGMGSFVTKPFVPEKPMSYNSCSELYFNITGINVNVTTTSIPNTKNDNIFAPYRLSYLWLSAVGFILVLLVGSLISLITGGMKGKDVDDELLSPVIRTLKRCWRRTSSKQTTQQKYKSNISLSTMTSIPENDFYYPDSGVYKRKDTNVIADERF